ncbi:hypothetical protein CBR59_07280 [Bacillus thuringiensis]|nr:hypothetical protein BK718_15690 [Bacillus thuringiensis serovar andalousiensis]PNK28818.1 hypothetical protein CBP87_15285 [Bacillus thuringiensis]PNK58102.1 hypothetical protein CBR59_07280 [Bacillus thuringiensis]
MIGYLFIVRYSLLVGLDNRFVLPFKGRKPDRKVISVTSIFKGTVKTVTTIFYLLLKVDHSKKCSIFAK